MSKLIVWARPYRGDSVRLALPARAGVPAADESELLIVERLVKVELEACPLSQLALSWNHLARMRGGPVPEAAGEERHNEVDALTLEVEGLSQAAEDSLVLHLLEGLPGLGRSTASPPSAR